MGPAGLCGAGPVARVFHEGIEWAGEAELVPTYVVSFSGCNMTCRFCLTGTSSQNASRGEVVEAAEIANRVASTPDLRSVTILGGEPLIHLPAALGLVALLPSRLPVVWKTNAFGSAEGLDLLEGIPDVVLGDLKFGNDECARSLAGIDGYLAVVRENLRRAHATSRLIVRHLVMPGHVECCTAPAIEWLSRSLPGVPLSLMTGFLPLFESAAAGLGRTNRPAEVERARSIVEASGVARAPWSIAPRTHVGERRPVPDEVWIDRSGNLCVDSASAELVAILLRLAPELKLTGTGG
jgi:putative pyruvate formate lyase activating enzyme